MTMKLPLSVWFPNNRYALAFIALLAVAVIAGVASFYLNVITLHVENERIEFEDTLRMKRLYAPLSSLANEAVKKIPGDFKSSPSKVFKNKPLAKSAIVTLPEVFRTMNETAGMVFISATPELQAIGKNSRFLRVIIRNDGEWPAYKRFLDALIEYPPLQYIRRIQVEQTVRARTYLTEIIVEIQ